jgi:hypothetical protein
MSAGSFSQLIWEATGIRVRDLLWLCRAKLACFYRSITLVVACTSEFVSRERSRLGDAPSHHGRGVLGQLVGSRRWSLDRREWRAAPVPAQAREERTAPGPTPRGPWRVPTPAREGGAASGSDSAPPFILVGIGFAAHSTCSIVTAPTARRRNTIPTPHGT